jgi:GxxExxY protein
MKEEAQPSAKGESPSYSEQELTGRILKAAFTVHNTLGVGFLERVCANALSLELQAVGISCQQELPLKVRYRGIIIGDYVADLVVENKVIVELKATSGLDPLHDAQVINYLRASGIKGGLLLNFGRPKLHYKRFVC